MRGALSLLFLATVSRLLIYFKFESSSLYLSTRVSPSQTSRCSVYLRHDVQSVYTLSPFRPLSSVARGRRDDVYVGHGWPG